MYQEEGLKFCQTEKLKIKIYLKVILEVLVARSGEKKRKRKITRFLYLVLIV